MAAIGALSRSHKSMPKSLAAAGSPPALTAPQLAVHGRQKSSNSAAARDPASINYYELAKELRSQLVLKTRMVKLRLYQDTAQANAITKWLVAHDYADSVAAAVKIGRKLTQYGHIYAVNEDRLESYEFEDNEQPFRFVLDDLDVAGNLQFADLVAIMTDLEHRTASTQDGLVIEGLHEHSGADLVSGIVALGYAWNRDQAASIAQRLIDEEVLVRVDTSARGGAQRQFKHSRGATYRSQHINHRPLPIVPSMASKSTTTAGVPVKLERPPVIPGVPSMDAILPESYMSSVASSTTTSRLNSASDGGTLLRRDLSGKSAASSSSRSNPSSKRSSRAKASAPRQLLRMSRIRANPDRSATHHSV
mmetsp:Transcript_15529/g.41759  ORF Transcript_15529/g.41759 Transcript_15529/m.41759 type:complete len:363 (+) Transcript_15529:483-1571(+)